MSRLADEQGNKDDPEQASIDAPLRPRDLAHLLLAGRDLLPRQRARDQQSDLSGIELKREVLQHLLALDPEPAELDIALEQIIVDMGPPYGPTRGICLSVRYDWEAACSSPQFVAWLLQEALREGEGRPRGKKRAT